MLDSFSNKYYIVINLQINRVRKCETISRVKQNNQQIGQIVRMFYVLSNLLDTVSNTVEYLSNIES